MMLGARIGGWVKRRSGLPYDYEVEWIKSDGASCVDIPVSATVNVPIADVENFSVDFDIVRPSGSGLQYILATHPLTLLRVAITANTGASTTLATCSTASKNLTYTGVAGTDVVDGVNFRAFTDADFIYFDYRKDGVWSKDTISSRGTTAATSYDIDRVTVLGYYNQTNRPPIYTQFSTHSKLKHLVLRSSSLGVNVDMIPVVKDGVGYLYDRVSGKLFGNSTGSGSLVVGPKKVRPYDYEVEWLQSDGVAYVDTDLDFSGFGLAQLPLLSSTGLVSFESVADITASNSRAYGFGPSVAVYHGARMYVGQGEKYPDSSNWVNNRFYTTGYSLERNNANAVEFSIFTNAVGNQSTRAAIGVCESGSFTPIMETSVSNAATSTGVTNSGMKFCLLGLNRNGSPIYTQTSSNTRLHRLSVVYDGVPIGAFIPVVKDGVGYFYDGVTGKLFGNSASSGALIIGPRVG